MTNVAKINNTTSVIKEIKEMRFSIIIPSYNCEETIVKLLDSIKAQTYKDYEVIIVDDISEDKSVEVIENYIEENKLNKFFLLKAVNKLFNGGTRNLGVKCAKGDYILFADCDDWFYSDKCLEEISKVIDKNKGIDLIRLSYAPCVNGYIGCVKLHENTLEELANTVFVAPWTKCIRKDLFIPFPENTLIEDVVQHIAQLDVIENYTFCDLPIMVWNRDNKNAISADGRQYSRDSKRFSSLYRNIADLIDLKVKKEYCKNRREQRINWYLDKVHHSKENEIVRTG